MSAHGLPAVSSPGVSAGLFNYSRHVSSQDINEHAAHMSGWRITYDQLSAGAFQGELFELCLDWMQVVRDRTNQALIKTGAARPGTIAFNIPLKCVGNAYCAGHALPNGSALVTHADDLPQLRAPQEVDVIVVSIDQAVLERELALHGIAFTAAHVPKVYQLEGLAVAQQLRGLIESVECESAGVQGWLNDESRRHQVRDAIMNQLLDLLPAEPPVELAPSARKRLVDRACEYALSHLDEPLTILDLCRHLGASRRKLQYCFQETLEINPLAYLRALRLNAVRRELLGSVASTSVQDAATRWGFWHLSRFSSEYREMFGELPSQTLNR